MSRTRTRAVLLLALSCILWTRGALLHAQAPGPTAVLNPNLAAESELVKLPHVSPALARTILASRPYLTQTQLNALLIKDLDRQQRAELYARLFVPMNANTATGAELTLVPGLAAAQLKALERHRPYRSIAQFRRDFGGSATKAELARLESYFFVPVNINTASDAQLLAIPGVNARVLRVLNNLRPFNNITQLRRELGRQIPASDVSRLERYITLE